ncbi:hypothetical protein B0H19DRAFT_1144713 [Mycena capillaripes]|nr:hypothetical protein B0H19DRAFT_1144713 [Mycena capillaripes]
MSEHEDEPDTPGGGSGAGNEKRRAAARRRSSKACDHCRRSKCKCERSRPGEPCRSCLALGIECVSLVPTRKRGPSKGYIDAIEARLHQTEALFGVLLAAANYSVAPHERINEDRMDVGDEEGRGSKDREIDLRARGLLDDIAEDLLAREILARIDQSAYGPAGRAAAAASGSGKDAVKGAETGSTHPSHEWMDRVTAHVLRRARLGSSSSSFSHRHGKNRGENGSGSNNSDSHVHVAPPQSLPHAAPLRHGSLERTQHSPSRSPSPSGLYSYEYQQQPALPQLPPHQRPAALTLPSFHMLGQSQHERQQETKILGITPGIW